jgi:hypothetical protein
VRKGRYAVGAWLSLVLAGSGFIAPAAANASSDPSGAHPPSGHGSRHVGAIPECGSGTSERCHIDITMHEAGPTTGGFCDSFSNRAGVCVGPVHGTPAWSQPSYFPRQGIQSSFDWKSPYADTRRDVDLTENANILIVEAYIRGMVPGPGSASFFVNDAYNRMSGVHWKTEGSAQSTPGLPGGPLYIDYESRIVGSYIHIYGYLVPSV